MANINRKVPRIPKIASIEGILCQKKMACSCLMKNPTGMHKIANIINNFFSIFSLVRTQTRLPDGGQVLADILRYFPKIFNILIIWVQKWYFLYYIFNVV